MIRATKTARNALLDIEELSEEELDRIKGRFEQLAQKARKESSVGQTAFIHPQVSPQAAMAELASLGGSSVPEKI